MTMPPAAYSSVLSRPLKALMNATSSPPGPAGWTSSPGGRPCDAAETTAFSVLPRLSPDTLTPLTLVTSGVKIDAAVLSAENITGPSVWLSTPGSAAIRPRAALMAVLSSGVSPLWRR